METRTIARQRRHFFVRTCILLITLLSLAVCAHCSPLSEKNILFYLPFDGSFDAKIARGSGSITSPTQAKLVEGYFGQGALVGNPESEIRYASSGNLNLDSGTVSMWVRPVGWGKGDTYIRNFFSIHGADANGQPDVTDFAWLYKYFIYSVSWLVKQASPQTEFFYVRAASGDTGGIIKYDWETDRWAHLLATWSGNQFVLYVDGKFAGSEYVPSRKLIRQPIKDFFIGGKNQRDNGTADTIIDDVIILDSPVTPYEAESIYKNGIAALRNYSSSSKPAFSVKSRFDLISNKIVMTSELIGLTRDEVKPFSITYLIENIQTGKKVASGRLTVKELLQNTPVDSKPLQLGKYKLTATLRESGKVVSRSTSEFEKLARPEWLGNTLGKIQTPPKPWVPLVKKGNTVACWEREYSWNNSVFPSSITAKGTQLLSRPITLYARVDGKPYRSLGKVSLRWDKVSLVRADFTARVMLADVPVLVNGYLEFDGFSWYKIKIDGGRKLSGRKLEFLSLDIPMRPDVSTLMYMYDPTKQLSGITRPLNTQLQYFPDIWLGNEKVGLQWSTEDFRDWNLIDYNKMVSISTEPKETLLRLVLVDHPISINRALTYTASLQATPVKPMPDDIRKWDMAIGTYKSDPPILDKTAFCYWSMWNRVGASQDGPYGYLVASPHTFSDLKNYQAVGVTPFIYWNTGMLWQGDPILRMFADWGNYEENAYQYNAIITDHSNPAMQDYLVWRSWKLFKDNPALANGTNGYYLDTTSARWIKGKGLYTLIGTRNMQKRSYLAVKKDWPELCYLNHESGMPNMSQLAFADMMLTGEDLCNEQLATDMNYYNILTLDDMRAEYLGEKFGMPHIFLPNIGRAVDSDKKKTEMVYGPEGIPAAEHVIGMMWIHDIPVYRAYMNPGPTDQSYRTKKAFGWDKSTQFIGYWENQELVKMVSDKSPVVTSIFTRNGRVLFVVMNNSDADAAVTLTPDWKKLGITPPTGLIDAYAEQDKNPSTIVLPVLNNSVFLTVKARNFRALVAR